MSKSPLTAEERGATFDFSQASLNRVFIGIAGLIGAGKSTLATALAKELDLPVYYEPVKDNEYLQDFYTDMKKHSFAMQVYLLNKRFAQQQQIVWKGDGGVQDRTIYEDSVFARMLRDAGLMEERDYQTYRSLFNHMANFMRKPNMIVFLDVSPEESIRRIRMRNRDCESGITLEYLQGLYAAYMDFISEISRVIPVIRVDYSQFRTVEEMAHRIAGEYRKISNIRTVTWEDSPASPAAVSPPTAPSTEATAAKGEKDEGVRDLAEVLAGMSAQSGEAKGMSTPLLSPIKGPGAAVNTSVAGEPLDA